MTTYTLAATLVAIAIYLLAILVAGDIVGPIRLIVKKQSPYGKDSAEYLRIKWIVVSYLFILGTMTILLPMLGAEGIRLGLIVNVISGLGVAIGFFVSKKLKQG